MRIIFVGAVLGSYRKLKYVLEAKGNVSAVITLNQDKGMKMHSDFCDLEPLARENKIDLFKINNINDPDVLKIISSYTPDFIFIWGWSQLVKKDLLNIPREGVIGFHPAMIPKNRGRHPVIWPLVKGDTKTGATFFFIDEGADSGDILAQREIDIDFTDDADSLMSKIDKVSKEMILDFVPKLNSGNYHRIQQDHSLATYLRKRTEEDGLIDFTQSTVTIYNLIRGLARPYPGAHTFFRENRIKVFRSKISDKPELQHKEGEVIAVSENGVKVSTVDGAILFCDVEMDGNNIEAICSKGLIKPGIILG